MANLCHIQRSRARQLRHSDTEAERRLWEDLRNRRLKGHKFVRQLPIGPYTSGIVNRPFLPSPLAGQGYCI